MNNLKNIFGLHVSRNVGPKSIQGIHQSEKLFRKKYLKSKFVKNDESDPFLETVKPNTDEYDSNFIEASNKTKTIYGSSRNSSSLEKSASLDSLTPKNNGPTLQVAGYKNITPNQINRVTNDKEMKKSSKPSESKISKENLANQEAHSYAKLIANYSRAMESDSVYTRSFEQNFGRAGISISDSPFNSVVPPLSKMKHTKQAKTGSILNTRNSSCSPKYRRVRDIQSADTDKNGNRNSFYSTDSGTYKEIVKTEDMMVKNAQITKGKMEKNVPKSDFKLDVKDVLDSVNERSEWLDRVIKAHKELKKRNTIENNNFVTSKPREPKLAQDRKKDQFQDSNKSDFNNRKPVPLIEVEAQCPIESSFMPIIDSHVSSPEIKSNLVQQNLIKSKTSSNSVKQIENKLPKSEFYDQKSKVENNSFQQEIVQNTKPEINEGAEKGRSASPDVLRESRNMNNFSQNPDDLSGSGNVNPNVSKTDSISPLNCINLRINGKPSSEFVARKGDIEVVNSVEKIEIRIPLSTLFPERKSEKEQIKELQKSESTLSLQISAKIEIQSEKNEGGHGAKFLNDEEKAVPKTEVNARSSETVKTSSEGPGVQKSVTTWKKEVSSLSKTDPLKDPKEFQLPLKESKSSIDKTASPTKNLTEAIVPTESKNPISKNAETSPKECLKESSVDAQKICNAERKEKLDVNLTKEFNPKNAAAIDANRAKIRKRKKGSTVISRVIESELEKQNEQVLKDKKIPAALTTETKKNVPVAEAVKPETKRLDQESSTIDKVSKKLDAVIDQNVAKKLNDNVPLAGEKLDDKKALGPSPSVPLKTKLKNQTTEEVSSKKAIDATSATGGKHTETKEQTGSSKIHPKPRMTKVDSQSGVKFPLKSQVENKTESSIKVKLAPVENLTTKRDLKKDIPEELKPLEKKKDGTLIDYGLKVATRKNSVSVHKTNKDQSPITATIKEIFTVKGKNISDDKVTFNTDQSKSTKVQFPRAQKKAELISGPKKSEKIIGTSSLVKGKDVLSVVSQKEEFDWINEKSKLVDFKSVLKLQEFEENHIFSGPDSHLQSTDFENTGVLRSSTARTEKKDSTVKPDDKGSHAKTTGSSVISDRGKVAVEIDDCSRNQSTSKINAMKKNCLKLFSKTSQFSSSKSASHVDRLMKISLNKSYSESPNVSNAVERLSSLKDSSQRPEKELLYSNWLQKYNNNVTIVTTD